MYYQAEKWHAFTVRIFRLSDEGEDAFSLRIDRHGNGLLYGRHQDDRSEFVAHILGELMNEL